MPLLFDKDRNLARTRPPYNGMKVEKQLSGSLSFDRWKDGPACWRKTGKG